MIVDAFEPSFETNPVPLYDEDVSSLFEAFRDLRAAGVTDLRAHLARHPEFAGEAARRTVIDRVNTATLTLLGANSVEDLRTRLPEIATPEFHRAMAQALVVLFEGGTRFEGLARNRRLDGSEVDVLLSLVLVDDRPGRERLLVATADVTDQRRAVRESEPRVPPPEQIRTAGGLGTFELDLGIGVVDFSPGAQTIMGAPECRVSFRWVEESIHEDDRADALGSFEAAVRLGRTLEVIHRIEHTRGERWVRVRGELTDPSAAPRILRGTIEDVTAEKTADLRLSQRLRRLEAMQAVNRAMDAAADPSELLPRLLAAIRAVFQADRAFLIHPCDPEAASFSVLHEDCGPGWPGAGSREFPMDPLTAMGFRGALADQQAFSVGPPPPPEYAALAEAFGAQSQMGVAIRPRGDKPWMLGMHACAEPRVWTDEDRDLFTRIGRQVADALARVSLWTELQAERRRVDLALAGSGAGLWDWDVPGEHITVDARFEALLGMEHGTLDSGFDALLARSHPDDGPALRTRISALLGGEGDAFDLEFRLRHTGGSWVWVSSRGRVAERGRSGLPVRIAGTLTDQTARKEAELALAEEKERAEVTLHSIGDAVITTDQRGLVQLLNPVAEELTGWTAEAARGRPIGEVFRLVSAESREPATNPVERVLSETPDAADPTGETLLLSRSGREYGVRDSAAPIRGADGDLVGVVLVFTDETDARLMAQRMSYEATHDALTGLINRREFESRLRRAIGSAQEHGATHTLCYLDLDQFKVVNDTAGHGAGDELLRRLAALLTQQVRARDTLARLGGDEFSLLLEHCPVDKGMAVAEKLIEAVRSFQFHWEDRILQVGVSVGVVGITAESGELAEILARADLSCYAAKDLGRNRAHLYSMLDVDLARRRGEMRRASELAEALRESRFRLHAQRIVPLAASGAGRPHYELLVRMIDPGGGLILPSAFIPAAERFDIMNGIDRVRVITEALGRYEEIFGAAEAGISINLSGSSLSDTDFLAFVQDALATSGVPHRRVCFEITETAAVANLGAARQFIGALRRAGCTFALDDFGSGLSSFAYLKQLPVDYLKIDGQFLRGIVDDPVDRAMVAAVNQLAHTMGIETIAEYVETAAIESVARELGVDYGQGYAIARPLELTELDLH